MKYFCGYCNRYYPRGYYDLDFFACRPCAVKVRKPYEQLRGNAVAEVGKAIKEGRLTRPHTCELCGGDHYTQAHHWNGYDNPLDVWWLCFSCHGRLRGVIYHIGIFTKEKAWKIIQTKVKRCPRRRGSYKPQMPKTRQFA